jgi:Ser/Thr protein kinase RdoA (MazF antagonist)
VHASVITEAIAAASAVAIEQGLRGVDAVPVGTGSNVIVHLRPAPVVARVMTGTVVLHRDPRAWLTRELEVATFLADRAPVVAPTREVDPGPYVRGHLWLSLWEYVDVRPIALTAAEIGRALRTLHDALAQYPGTLPPRAGVLAEIDWLLYAMADADDVSQFAAERDRLADFIRDADATEQPLHGDASLSNLLATSNGPCWNDFEDVCVGAVEWDVAGVLSDARARYGEIFSAELLAAYGAGLDPALITQIDQVHALYGSLWRRYVGR